MPPFSLASSCLIQSYDAPTKQLTLCVSLASSHLRQSYNAPTKQSTLCVLLAFSRLRLSYYEATAQAAPPFSVASLLFRRRKAREV